MIFGKTFKERQDAHEAEIAAQWVFAWRPVQLTTGRYAWLHNVYRIWTGSKFIYREDEPKPLAVDAAAFCGGASGSAVGTPGVIRHEHIIREASPPGGYGGGWA